jgi:hypothetical protein
LRRATGRDIEGDIGRAARGLPAGSGRGELLVLRRSDGSAVASFAFSAFGPTPEAVREAAEEDYRKGRRRAQGGEDGEEERGR